MGDTLLDFAKPLVGRLPRDYTVDELSATLRFAAAIWNAVLIRDSREAIAQLGTMPPRLRVPHALGMATLRMFLQRRRRYKFRTDCHFIVAVNVYDDGPQFSASAIGVCPDRSCCGPQAEA